MEQVMTDDLTIPEFLDRKQNGIRTELPKTRGPRKRKAKAAPDNTVRIYLWSRMRGLSCGWHDVEVVTLGYKHVRFRAVGKSQCVRVSRSVWDELKKEQGNEHQDRNQGSSHPKRGQLSDMPDQSG
jgi:hypothetical protein